MQDLIAGRIDYMVRFTIDIVATDRSQPVKAIATTGQRRSASLPKVPTAQEQGLNFEVHSWQGLFLPQGTPQPIVRRLTQAIGETLDTRSVRDRFEAIGEGVISPERRGPEYFAKFVVEEIARWLSELGESGVSVE